MQKSDSFSAPPRGRDKENHPQVKVGEFSRTPMGISGSKVTE
jgi:hypothetical protein